MFSLLVSPSNLTFDSSYKVMPQDLLYYLQPLKCQSTAERQDRAVEIELMPEGLTLAMPGPTHLRHGRLQCSGLVPAQDMNLAEEEGFLSAQKARKGHKKQTYFASKNKNEHCTRHF